MENFLNNCISSLVVSDELMDAQEIIIVNDGSKDKTLKIATDWANKFQNSIRIIDKKNGNYGSCINAALNIATGTFVKVLDADDSFDTNNYEDFLNLFFIIFTRFSPSIYSHPTPHSYEKLSTSFILL